MVVGHCGLPELENAVAATTVAATKKGSDSRPAFAPRRKRVGFVAFVAPLSTERRAHDFARAVPRAKA
jgi:hypothetical protein